jgi:hypothetical protein
MSVVTLMDPGGRGIGCHLRHASHFLTSVRALTADLDARFHISHALAAIRTGIANLGASCADDGVHRGIADHEICRGLANFRTVDHQAQVFFLDMFPP